MLKLVKELEETLGVPVGLKIDHTLVLPEEDRCKGTPALTATLSGRLAELYIPVLLSAREKSLIAYILDAYSALYPVHMTPYQALFLTETGYLEFDRPITFPMRFWRIRFQSGGEEAKAVLHSLFLKDRIVDLAPGLSVVLMPDAAISPEEVLDTLEADAMTSAGITVSRVCARAEQIHARYLELDEAEEAAERLHLGTRVVRVEKMFFQQFLWRNRQGFAKEKTVSPLIEDSILKETARAFLNSDLNVTTAAEKLGIHRNTLLYRLNRIEVETGIDLKRFDDAAGYYFSEMIDKFHKIVKEAD
ncbi:MAG: carbohydrate diacid regulator [Clostridiales bacterium]|jgi:hypothetical protein|nr:carbohydrate diacid regulator [Clostridiales bacterium]